MIRFVWLLSLSMLACLLCFESIEAASTSVNVPITVTTGAVGSNEEFVGPFASWVCARSSASGTCGAAAAGFCNAAGDGTTDDTSAIQTCLNSLGPSTPVLYFPAGTYKVSQTLSVGGQTGVALMGADPATTTILWAGNSSSSAANLTGSISTSCEVATCSVTGASVAGGGTSGYLVGDTLTATGGTFSVAAQFHVATVNGSGQVTSVSVLTAGTYTGIPANPVTVTGGSGTGTVTLTVSWTDLTFTLAASGVTGSILPGQLLAGTSVPNITYVVASLGGGNYTVAPNSSNFGFPVNISSEAMTTTNASILWVNGLSYSRFNRLTFNGQGNANVAVDQSKAQSDPCCFDTSNEWTDDVFENVGTGFLCGNNDYGCSEISILRDQFLTNTTAGIAMRNFNALDMWVWYSTFRNCAYGLTNAAIAGSAGVFHVFNSVFIHSPAATSGADVNYGNAGAWNFRNNYSINANRFLSSGGLTGPNPALLQGNTILDTTDPIAIDQGDWGPVVLIDNVIRNASGNTTGPVVNVGNSGAGDVFSMGNTYTVSTAACGGAVTVISGGRCHSIAPPDQVVSRGTVNPSQPTLPGTPPNLGRTVYEASPTGSGTTCSVAFPCSVQQAITNAAVGCSNNVAHIKFGTYSIGTTITVPASCAIQIIGDGLGNTQLNSSGANPVLKLSGPSLATLGYFEVSGGSSSIDGIEIDDVDAGGSGGRVFVESSTLASSTNDLFVDAIDYANVEVHNTSYVPVTTNPGVVITGGAHGGVFSQYLGSAFGYVFQISGSANVNLEGVWNEVDSAAVPNLVNLTGTGTLSYAGSEFGVSYSPAVLNGAVVTNFTGAATFLNLLQPSVCPGNGTCGTWGNFSITGTGTNGNVLGLGLICPSTTCWGDTTSPADTNELLNSQQFDTAQITEVGSANSTFLATTLSLLRNNQPRLPVALPPGETNVGIYGMNISSARYGLHLVHN